MINIWSEFQEYVHFIFFKVLFRYIHNFSSGVCFVYYVWNTMTADITGAVFFFFFKASMRKEPKLIIIFIFILKSVFEMWMSCISYNIEPIKSRQKKKNQNARFIWSVGKLNQIMHQLYDVKHSEGNNTSTNENFKSHLSQWNNPCNT